MPDRKPTARGELRRRHRALISGGSLGRMGSEARLMVCYVLYWADFEKCTLKMSIRGAAKVLGVTPNGVRRGIQQLLDEGVLILVSRGSGSNRSQYELAPPPGHATGALGPRSVTPPVTTGDRGAHVACTERTRYVTPIQISLLVFRVIPIERFNLPIRPAQPVRNRLTGPRKGGQHESGTCWAQGTFRAVPPPRPAGHNREHDGDRVAAGREGD